jgi:hypothetical protein
MGRDQRLFYTAQDIMVVWHRAYLLGVQDVLADLEDAASLDELKIVIEQTLVKASDSYQAALRRQEEVDGVG